ncbi:peptide chain release factor N(5)-glutamine methyltransferase, partial [Tsukamurella soli]|uniref:peptide chain release factor N(5)-glutamine methyltransferase n=1 Tax=Tsukamurella soli TaxID=644556 RepID=UPI0031E7C080
GVPSPRVDAELLLAHVLGIDRGRLIAADDATVAQRAEFDALLARRAAREPLQHLLGRAPFGALELRVGPGVFVPRPETELVADWAARHASRGARVVDLCAGSGALALFLATTVPGAAVVAVERDPTALEYLRVNAAESGDGRVTVVDSDVRSPDLPQRVRGLLGGAADVVVCNPPYVPDGAALAPEAAADPPAALFSGVDGLDLIRELGPVIAAIGAPGAAIAVEHDDGNADGVVSALADVGATGLERHLDLAGRPRYVTGFTPR